LKCRQFEKGEYLVKAGEVSQRFYFVVSGLTRVFHLNKDKEINTGFFWGEQFVTDYASFITRHPSVEFAQCLEDTKVITFDYSSVKFLYKNTHSWETLCRLFVEQRFLEVTSRAVFLQTGDAKQRYMAFVKNTPTNLVKKIPNYQIASYLGITPESLSRVRQKINSAC